MIPTAWNKWYSQKINKVNLTDESRTHDLVTELRHESNIPSFEVFNKNLNLLIPDYSALGLISYLDTHPDMINYEFDIEGKLIKINVDPNKIFTFKRDSKVRQCNMSLGITKLLESYFSSLNHEVQVTMVNKDYCKKVEGTAVHTEANAADTADTDAYDDAAPAPYSDTAPPAGGSKSRRRHRHHARKTRRGLGRTRKSNSKSKPKTHRRRRAHHSRTRKHKKYTRKC